MRKTIPFLCLIFLFGCSFSRTAETDEAGIRETYRTLTERSVKAEISAEFPDHIATYLVDYTHRKSGACRLTVIEPASIAGITVTLDGETPILSVGETRLETGDLDENGLSPISVLPRLFRLWETAADEVESVENRGEDQLLTVYHEEELTYRTLFSRESYLPVRAEVFCAGECVLRIRFVT